MAIRDGYCNFKFFDMISGLVNQTFTAAGGSASGTALDTRGYETVAIVLNIASAAGGPQSAYQVTLMHASVDDSVSYVFVSSSDLFGSDITFNSEYVVSFGGSMQLGLTAASGVILDFSFAAASMASADSIWAFGYKGRERYLKLMVDSVGAVAGGSVILTALGILGLPGNWPVNDPNP